MIKPLARIIILSLLTWTQLHSHVHAESLEELMNMSLEELSKIQVTVASKTPNPQPDAPGIVTAYSRKFMDQLGYYTIADLADITPGYSSYYIYGERVFETRGQKASSYDNQKHLLIIDGIPFAHARANKAIIEEELPLYFADRVEFLRGPGSALYGSSAFYGVVNIEPTELDIEGSRSTLKTSVGNNDQEKRVMFNSLKRTNRANLSLNLGFYEKAASEDFVGQIRDPLYVKFDDQDSQFLRFNYNALTGKAKGLAAGIIYTNTRGGIGEFWMHTPISHQVNEISWTTMVPYIKFEKSLNDQVQLNSYLKYNRSSQTGTTLLTPRSVFESLAADSKPLLIYEVIIENYEFQSEARVNLSPTSNFILGLNYDTRKQSDDSFFYRINTTANAPVIDDFVTSEEYGRIHTYGLFTQYQTEFDILNGLLITAGARLDYGDSDTGTYNQLSPRFALVQKLNPNWNLKVLMGTALRSEGIKEVSLNNQIAEALKEENETISLDNIDPERISTSELGFTYNDENTSASLTFFYNQTRDEIVRVPVSETRVEDQVFGNSPGKTKAHGGEIEITRMIGDRFRAFGNYSYANAENNDGQELNDVPTSKANLGATMQEKNYSLTLVAKRINGYRLANTTDYNTPGGFTVVDMNYMRRLSSDVIIECKLSNATNEEYRLPKTSVGYGYDERNLGDVPIPKRSLLFSVEVEL